MSRRLPILIAILLVLIPMLDVLPIGESSAIGNESAALAFAAETDVVVEPAGEVATETPTATETATALPSETPTATATVEPTATVTDVPIATETATATATATATSESTAVPTATTTATSTATELPTLTSTATPTAGLSLSATSGEVGSTVRFQIRSFPAESRVAIRFDGMRLLTVTTDTDGGRRDEFDVPSGTTGQHEISADGGGRRVARSFSVTPAIALSATNVRAGRSLTVSLTGFNGDASVQLRLYAVAPATGYVTLARLSADATGSASRSVEIPANAENGLHRILAVQSGGDDVDADVHVLGGTATRTATVRPTRTATPRPTRTPTPQPTRTATPRPRATSTPRPRIEVVVTVSCEAVPELTRIENRSNVDVTLEAIGSLVNAGPDEPFDVDRTLRPGASVAYQSGPSAKSPILTKKYIYLNGDSREGARVKTDRGAFTDRC